MGVGRKDIIKTIHFVKKKKKPALSSQRALISLLHCIWKVLLKCHSGSATRQRPSRKKKKGQLGNKRQLKDKSMHVLKE